MVVTQLETFVPRTALWQRWQHVEPILMGQDFPAVRRDLLDRAVPPDHKDELLAALIRLSRTSDDGEARIATIACLLPGARKLAGRFVRVLGWDDALAEVIAALWVALDRIDLDKGGDHVASRILALARQQLARRARRECAWRDRTTGLVDLDTFETSPPAASRPVTADAVGLGVLTDLDAVLIDSTRLNGLSLHDASTLLGINYEAAKKRRRRAEAAWVEWWASQNPTPSRNLDPIAA